MFKDGVDSSQVTGRCEYVKQRATITSSSLCLPGSDISLFESVEHNVKFYQITHQHAVT